MPPENPHRNLPMAVLPPSQFCCAALFEPPPRPRTHPTSARPHTTHPVVMKGMAWLAKKGTVVSAVVSWPPPCVAVDLRTVMSSRQPHGALPEQSCGAPGWGLRCVQGQAGARLCQDRASCWAVGCAMGARTLGRPQPSRSSCLQNT